MYNKRKEEKSILTKILNKMIDSQKERFILKIILYLEFDDVLSLKYVNHFYKNLISKKIIKLYALNGNITESKRKLYYFKMININKTIKMIYNELIDYKIEKNFYSEILKLSEIEKSKQNKQFIKVCNEIGRDISRTFYTKLFTHGNGQQMLNNILTAVAFIRPEIGYCQGMNFIAGALLDYLKEEKISFYIFLTFIDNIELNLLYLKNMPDYYVRVFQLEHYINTFFPDLYTHFKNNQINTDIFFSKWILTIFSSYLSFDVLYYVWDVFIIDKWKAIFKFSMCIFAVMHDVLLGMDIQAFSQYFRTNVINNVLNFKLIAKHYNKYKITNKQLNELREDFFAQQVKLKLEDTNANWEQDQKEYVINYNEQLNKHINKVNTQIQNIDDNLYQLNKDYLLAESNYEKNKNRCDVIRLKVEILIGTKEGYENVLNNIKSVDNKKSSFLHNMLHSNQKDKISKKLNDVNKNLISKNEELMEKLDLRDKNKIKMDSLINKINILKKNKDDIIKKSNFFKKNLLKNLSQKLKLTEKFVQTNKY